jgi:hypothetical protein
MWGYDVDTANPYVLGHPELFSITWNNGIPSGTFTVYQIIQTMLMLILHGLQIKVM